MQRPILRFFCPDVAAMGAKFGVNEERTKGLLLHAKFHPLSATVRV